MRTSAFVSLLTTIALILSPAVAQADEGHPKPPPPQPHCKPAVSVVADRNRVTVKITPDTRYQDTEAAVADDPEPVETPVVMPTDLPTDEPTTPVVMPTSFATEQPVDEPHPYVMPTELASLADGARNLRTTKTVKHPWRNCQAAKYTVWVNNKESDWGATNEPYVKTMTVPYGTKVAAAAWQDVRGYDEVLVSRMAPTAPQNLHDTEITQTSLTLAWTPPADDGGSPVKWYAVHYANGGEDTVFTTSYRAQNLLPGTKYTFEVWAVNEVGASPGAVITVWTDPQPTPPGPPSSLATADVTKTAMTVTWDAPATDGGDAITGYRLEVDGKVVTTADAKDRSYRLTGLRGGTTYDLALYALNEIGESTPAKASGTTAPATAPGPVEAFSVVKVTADSAAITWTAPLDDGGSPVTSYLVSATDEQGHVQAALTKSTNHAFTKLDSATKYTIVVAAKNAVGTGAEDSRTIRTPLKPVPRPDYPGVPRELTSADVQYSSFRLTWQAPAKSGSAPIRDYEVDVNGETYATTTVTSVSVTDRVAGRTYNVQVRARNADGYWGGPAEIAVTTKAQSVPSEVRDLTTASPDQTSIVLNWQAPADEGGSPITNYHVAWGPLPTQQADTGTQTFVKAKGLTAATEYRFAVTAQNATGTSPEVQVVGLTNMDPVPEPQAPLAPANLTAPSVTKSTISLAWDKPASDGGSDVLAYRVYKDGSLWAETEADERTFEFTTLTAGRTYAFDVTAVNQMGESVKAPISVTTTAPTAPGVVQDAKVGEVMQTTIAASWAPPLDDGGRRVLDYTVTWTDGASSKGELVATEEQALIPGLLEATEYTITVQARNEVGRSEAVTLTATTLFTPVPTRVPRPPKSVSATKIQFHGLTLTWTDPDKRAGDFPILGYQVYVDGVESLYTTKKSVNLDGLESGRTYNIGVAIENTIGLGEPKVIPVTMKSSTVPSPVRALNASGPTLTSLTVDWKAPASDGGSVIQKYVVDWFATNDHQDSGMKEVIKETSAEITGLKSGTEYTFRVSAVNAIGASRRAVTSGWTVMRPVPTPKAPDTPEGFAAGPPSQTSVVVSWLPSNSTGGNEPAGYTLTWGNETRQVGPDVTAYRITGLSAATEYTVDIVATNQMGSSAPASVRVLTNMDPVPEPQLPSEPLNLTVAGVGYDSVALTWDKPANDGGANVTEYLITWGGQEARVAFDTAAVVHGLRESTAYTFEVSARNSMGYGPASRVDATTTVKPAPGPTPGPTPKPTPITPAATGTNANGTLNADADPRSLRQTVTGRWPANTTMLSGKTKLVERKSQLVSNAGQNAAMSVTYKSPSIQKAALVLNSKTKEWTLRVWLKPKKVSGSVVVTASAPAKTVNGVRYEPLQASKKFIIKDSAYKKG